MMHPDYAPNHGGEGRMNQMAHCMAAAVTPKRIALGGETARTG
jgi:hypothetical protein